MTAAIYTSTEKKRIRKSFAKRHAVLNVPFLLATQLESYTQFLQAQVPPNERKNEGLQAAFTSIFPISSHSGNARLEFVSFALGEPPFDVKECQQRGLTYAAPLRAKVRLTIMDKEAPKPTVKEVKEQEVYMGEIPLMTKTGSFIINGTERVIVSQLHRSPGVFFEHDRGKTHSSGKLLFSARIIPYRGSWLDFEFDAEGLRLLPHRPAPQDAGHDPAQGDRHDAGADPRDVLRLRRIPSRAGRGRVRARSGAATRRGGAVRLRRQVRQNDRAAGQADHRQAHPRHGGRRAQAHRGTRRFHRSGARSRTTSSTRSRARSSPPRTRRSPTRCSRSCAAAKRRPHPDDLLQRSRPGRLHLANAAHRRNRRPMGGAGRHLPHDAPRRAADRGRGRDAVQRPLLRRGALRPVDGRADEVQSPSLSGEARRALARLGAPVQPARRVEGLGRRRDAVERRSPRGRDDHGRAAQRPRRHRRHRPPRQPPGAVGRRARREPVPGGPRARRACGEGATVAGRERQSDAARPDQR